MWESPVRVTRIGRSFRRAIIVGLCEGIVDTKVGDHCECLVVAVREIDEEGMRLEELEEGQGGHFATVGKQTEMQVGYLSMWRQILRWRGSRKLTNNMHESQRVVVLARAREESR